MTAVIQRLAKRIQTPSGKLRRGALSRTSEHLGISRTTIRKWLDGEWTPGKATCAEIRAMLADKSVELTAKKTGPQNYFSEKNGHSAK